LAEIDFYVDVTMDESYTPEHITIKAGNSFADLKVRGSTCRDCSFQKE